MILLNHKKKSSSGLTVLTTNILCQPCVHFCWTVGKKIIIYYHIHCRTRSEDEQIEAGQVLALRSACPARTRRRTWDNYPTLPSFFLTFWRGAMLLVGAGSRWQPAKDTSRFVGTRLFARWSILDGKHRLRLTREWWMEFILLLLPSSSGGLHVCFRIRVTVCRVYIEANGLLR